MCRPKTDGENNQNRWNLEINIIKTARLQQLHEEDRQVRSGRLEAPTQTGQIHVLPLQYASSIRARLLDMVELAEQEYD